MTYILDSNIFMTSNQVMPMDLWPTFWEKFKMMLRSNEVCSIEKVKEEIENGHDELMPFINEANPSLFIPLDSDIIAEFAKIQNWARENPVEFKEEALMEFARVADAFLVATAVAKNLTVVTYETSEPNRRSRVKIPDVCMAFGIQYCRLNDLLRALQITI